MIQEIQMPVADIKPFTADEWAKLWRKEADARNALWKEHQEIKLELEQYRSIAEKLGATKAISQLDEAKAAIKHAHWHFLSLLKPGDEKTKAVIEQLQKFL